MRCGSCRPDSAVVLHPASEREIALSQPPNLVGRLIDGRGLGRGRVRWNWAAAGLAQKTFGPDQPCKCLDEACITMAGPPIYEKPYQRLQPLSIPKAGFAKPALACRPPAWAREGAGGRRPHDCPHARAGLWPAGRTPPPASRQLRGRSPFAAAGRAMP